MNNSETQVLGVGGASTAIIGVLTALQVDDVLKWIQLALAIITSAVSLAYAVWRWTKKAKQDGKIDASEVIDLAETIKDEADKAKESIGEVLNKINEKEKEKEDEKHRKP